MTTLPAAGFLDALRALAAALERLGSPAMVIGGVAVMNLSRVRRVVAEFSSLLEDDERPRALERLIHRADLAS